MTSYMNFKGLCKKIRMQTVAFKKFRARVFL